MWAARETVQRPFPAATSSVCEITCRRDKRWVLWGAGILGLEGKVGRCGELMHSDPTFYSEYVDVIKESCVRCLRGLTAWSIGLGARITQSV